MIIILDKDATDDQVQHVIERLLERGYDIHRSTGAESLVLGVVGDTHLADVRTYRQLDGVRNVVKITEPYRLAARAFQHENTVVEVGDVSIGGDRLTLLAGPAVVESKEQTEQCALAIKEAGGHILRAGVIDRVNSSQIARVNVTLLGYLRSAADRYDLAVVSEIVSAVDIDPARQYVDMFQVGAANMQNQPLLAALGTTDKPVLIERGPAATIREFLTAAETLLVAGNRKVVLCERGIRTFEDATPCTLDLAAVAVLEKLSHLPVVVAPSSAAGLRSNVGSLARAAVAAGAHGVMIDIHPQPDRAVIDGAQALDFEQFRQLTQELRAVATAIGRK